MLKRTFDARSRRIMASMTLAPGYKSYILRVWQVERDDQPTLAAVLEDCQTSQRQTFPSLAALVEFLETGKLPTPLAAHKSQSDVFDDAWTDGET